MLERPSPTLAADTGWLLHPLRTHLALLDDVPAAGAPPQDGGIAATRVLIRRLFDDPRFAAVEPRLRAALDACLAEAFFELSLVRTDEPAAAAGCYARRAVVWLRRAIRELEGWVVP